jgi:hypothetical protein
VHSRHRIAPGSRVFLILAVFTAGGCFSPPRQISRDIPATTLPREEAWEIVDHEETGAGGLPEWVSRYLQGGSRPGSRPGDRSIEEMPEFAGRYVFVSEAEGVSLPALEQRLLSFDVPLDFPQLAAFRVQRRLTGLGGDQPGAAFSHYQEEAVRAVADAAWFGARREGHFWLRRSFPGEPGAEERESYLSLILLSFDQAEFRSFLDPLLWQRTEDPETEQAQVLRRIRGVFYDDF